MAWLSDNLDANVRVRCRIPDGAAVVSQTELLAIADQETAKTFVPYVCALGEEYAIDHLDWTITDGVSQYQIPSRAVAAALRDVVLINSSGVGVSIPRISLEERDEYDTSASWRWRHGAAFCLERSEVILRPGTGLGGSTLRMRFQTRPGKLILESAAGTISAVVSSGGIVSQLTIGSGTEPTTGTGVDVIQAHPPFDLLLWDASWTLDTGSTYDISGANTLYKATTGPSSVAVGDYVAPQGYTPVIQLPEPLHPVLEAATAARVFSLMREFKAAADAREEVRESLAGLRGLFTSRVKGEEQIIVNRRSFLRGGWAR